MQTAVREVLLIEVDVVFILNESILDRFTYNEGVVDCHYVGVVFHFEKDVSFTDYVISFAHLLDPMLTDLLDGHGLVVLETGGHVYSSVGALSHIGSDDLVVAERRLIRILTLNGFTLSLTAFGTRLDGLLVALRTIVLHSLLSTTVPVSRCTHGHVPRELVHLRDFSDGLQMTRVEDVECLPWLLGPWMAAV